MKINNQYILREIAGENIIIKDSATEVDMTSIISFNKTAAYLWEELYNKDFQTEDVVAILIDKYGIEQELASKDANNFINVLKSNNFIL